MTDIKHLLKEFERFAYGQPLHAALTDMLDWVLLPFRRYEDKLEQQAGLNTYHKEDYDDLADFYDEKSRMKFLRTEAFTGQGKPYVIRSYFNYDPGTGEPILLNRQNVGKKTVAEMAGR